MTSEEMTGAGVGGAGVGGAGVIRAGQGSALTRAVALFAAICQVTVLIPVLYYAHDYRQPAVPVALWAGLLVAAAWLLPRARKTGLTGRQSAAAITIAVVVVAAVGWERQHGAGGAVDWSVLGTAWLLALVAFGRPAWEWICGALLVFAAHAFVAVRLLGLAPLSLARLAATLYTVAVVLVIFAALRPSWRTEAGMAARRAMLASRAAAEHEAADAVRGDQRARLALLERDALPLLRGIADGTLDPADTEVRKRCAGHATVLRSALTERATGTGGLLTGLEPVLRAARERGLQVDVQAIGDPGIPPPAAVAAATAAARGAVLSVLPPQQATLTVLAAPAGRELYLTFGQPPSQPPDLGSIASVDLGPDGWQVTVDLSDPAAGCLELCWRASQDDVRADVTAVPAEQVRGAGG